MTRQTTLEVINPGDYELLLVDNKRTTTRCPLTKANKILSKMLPVAQLVLVKNGLNIEYQGKTFNLVPAKAKKIDNFYCCLLPKGELCYLPALENELLFRLKNFSGQHLIESLLGFLLALFFVCLIPYFTTAKETVSRQVAKKEDQQEIVKIKEKKNSNGAPAATVLKKITTVGPLAVVHKLFVAGKLAEAEKKLRQLLLSRQFTEGDINLLIKKHLIEIVAFRCQKEIDDSQATLSSCLQQLKQLGRLSEKKSKELIALFQPQAKEKYQKIYSLLPYDRKRALQICPQLSALTLKKDPLNKICQKR